MPRKKAVPTKNTPPPELKGEYWLPPEAEWGGFINIRLDDEQKQQFTEYYAAFSEEIPSALDDLLGKGMKFSVSYDHENQSYVASFTGRLVRSMDLRCSTSSRHSTFQEAVALLVWKHHAMADGDYGNFKTNGRRADWG